METLGYHLLENVSYENYDLALTTVATIRNFIELAKNIYEIEPVNARILNQELNTLAEELQRKAGIEGELDLETMFSGKEEDSSRKGERPPTLTKVSVPMENAQNKGSDPRERQARILEMLGNPETGSLSLRELSRNFPGVTPRTIRNDLRELVERDLITREGSGPASMYTKKSATPADPTTPPAPSDVINL